MYDICHDDEPEVAGVEPNTEDCNNYSRNWTQQQKGFLISYFNRFNNHQLWDGGKVIVDR